MYLHAPKNMDTAKLKPLVVVLHGCLQCASTVAKQTDWNKLADEYGFYVLYPQQRIFNNPMRCYKWYKRKNNKPGKGENQSIKQMIDYTISHYTINPQNVSITGLSAGAAMTVIMLATHPQTFKAGASFAGAPYKVATSIVPVVLAYFGLRVKSAEKWGNLIRKVNQNKNVNYPKLIIYQGNNDWVVNKRNGVELMKQWTNIHGITSSPTQTINSYTGNKLIKKETFIKNGEEKVVFYRISKLSHALPIYPGKCEYQGGKRGIFSRDLHYNSTIFTAYDFGLIALQKIEGKNEVDANEKQVEFTIQKKENASYQWVFPDDCTSVRNDSGNKLMLDWGSKSGSVSVIEQEFSGCVNYFPSHYVEVKK
jgi:poly(hydroxyalkanoate) depolymerase family esterase